MQPAKGVVEMSHVTTWCAFVRTKMNPDALPTRHAQINEVINCTGQRNYKELLTRAKVHTLKNH